MDFLDFGFGVFNGSKLALALTWVNRLKNEALGPHITPCDILFE